MRSIQARRARSVEEDPRYDSLVFIEGGNKALTLADCADTWFWFYAGLFFQRFRKSETRRGCS